jgi:hypothetical protein
MFEDSCHLELYAVYSGNRYIPKNPSAVIFRTKQWKEVVILELVDHETAGTTVVRYVPNCVPVEECKFKMSKFILYPRFNP